MSDNVVALFPWPQLSAGNFGAFWQLYPRRVARIEAERAWSRLNLQQRIAALKALPEHIRAWEHAGTERRFIPHPSTWINQHRFEDELDDGRALGQCEWNKNGTREPGAPRCCEDGAHTNDRGNVYCQAHAVSLGLVKRRATA